MANSINSLYDLQRIQQTQTSGLSKINKQNEEEEAILNFSDSNSEDNTKTLDKIEDEYSIAAAAIQEKEEAEKAGDTEKAEDAEETANDAVEEAQNIEDTKGTKTITKTRELTEEEEEKLEELKEEKDDNDEAMNKLEDEIQEKTESAEDNISEAKTKQQKAVEQHKDEAKEVQKENLQAFEAANKEGGEGMTREELNENIKSEMPNAPDVSDAVNLMTTANEELDEADELLGDLNDLISENQTIERDINAIEGSKEVEVPEEECCPPPCEPQGFQDTEGNQYDFFIDKDKNGDLSSEKEFLGYEGGLTGQKEAWEEMTSLDADGDGTVNAQELSAGGVMVYKTDADGNQKAMSIEEAFGKDSDLAINTKQHEQAKENVGPNNFNVGEGSENNELWGTFDVTLNGETLDGYQTSDDINWLKDNYNFTNLSEEAEAADGIGETEAAEEAEDSEDEASFDISDELQAHINFYNEYTEKVKDLRAELNEIYSSIDLTDEEIKGIDNAIKSEAKEKSENFFNTLTEENKEDNKEVAEEEPVEASAASSQAETILPDEIEDKTAASVEEEKEEDLLKEEKIAA